MTPAGRDAGRCPVGAVVLAAAALLAANAAAAQPTLGGCPVFPADNYWNVRVDSLPVHPSSAAYMASIGAANLHPDFGSGTYEGHEFGIPYVVVPSSQPPVPITYYPDWGDWPEQGWPDESDPGPFPVPPNAPIEGQPDPDPGWDRHVLVVRQGECRLYELYHSFPDGAPGFGWHASSGASWDLRSNALRPDGWTSADAAGLSILAGLVRYDEAIAGEVLHAIRFTATNGAIRNTHAWPARHDANPGNDSASQPPMGQRFRLKASYAIPPSYAPEVKAILTAMKRYGLVLADNGSRWYVSGAHDERWDNDHLDQLKNVPSSAFEAVDTSSMPMEGADSAKACGGLRCEDWESGTIEPARWTPGP